jgi:hypothetical protein
MISLAGHDTRNCLRTISALLLSFPSFQNHFAIFSKMLKSGNFDSVLSLGGLLSSKRKGGSDNSSPNIGGCYAKSS